MRRPHILVIEDHKALRDLLVIALRKESFRVTAVENGCTAVRVMPAENFDVIVTDILMPGKDGLEVIGFARAAQPTARIVAISGGSAGLDASLCLRLSSSMGADRVLRKPFTVQQFIHLVTELAGTGGMAEVRGEHRARAALSDPARTETTA